MEHRADPEADPGDPGSLLRQATDQDLEILAALISPRLVPDTGYTYVLPLADGGLALAAHLEVEGKQGRLELLVIVEDAYTPAAERRIIGVAGTLAVGHGCRTLEVEVRALGPRETVLH